MKNFFYLFMFFVSSSLLFSSCKSDPIETTTPKLEAAPNHRIADRPNVLFVASPKTWYATDCLPSFGTCRWIILEERICEVSFTGDIDDGIIYINGEDTPDVLFTIETYGGQGDVIGFRFKGFSDEFLAASAANGDDGSTFTVEDNYNLQEETVGLLGYQSIQLQEGVYDMVIDPATNEKVVYISAISEQ